MNVLVLETVEKGHRELIGALERHGHNVDVVYDIETARASQIAGTHPLVFLDVDAFGEDAIEWCAHIRKRFGIRSVILALIESEEPALIERLLDVGFDDYLITSLDPGIVDIRIRIAGRRARRFVAATSLDAISYGVFGCQIDRHQHEMLEELRESEARYRIIADNVADMIWTSKQEDIGKQLLETPDEDMEQLAIDMVDKWKFSYVSPSSKSFLGYSAEEMEQIKLSELLWPDTLQEAIELFTYKLRLEKQGVLDSDSTMELEHRTKDGSVVFVEVTTSFLRDDRGIITAVIGITRDITKRRDTEIALRESEATLRGLFENMPDLVIVTDIEGVVLYVSRGAMGKTSEELVGTVCDDSIAPEFRDVYRTTFAEAIEQKQVRVLDVQSRSERWWACRMVPIVEEDVVRNVMVICTDVTEKRKSQKVIEKEQELVRQLLDLFEKDRELIAFEIHDGFSQQLTGALLNFEAAVQFYKSRPKEAEENFNKGRLLLQESIVESRRLVAGLRPPVLDEFGIVPAVEHLVVECRERGKAKIEFFSDIRNERLARPLESAIFRIVQETLHNANQHSQSDRIIVELGERENRVTIGVKDWGVGFDPDEVDESHFGVKGIRERARLLGGKAAIDTTIGKGTTVYVELPLIERTAADSDEREQAEGATDTS